MIDSIKSAVQGLQKNVKFHSNNFRISFPDPIYSSSPAFHHQTWQIIEVMNSFRYS